MGRWGHGDCLGWYTGGTGGCGVVPRWAGGKGIYRGMGQIIAGPGGGGRVRFRGGSWEREVGDEKVPSA